MLDEEASQRTFDDVHQKFVQPELERRRGARNLPKGFRIRRCLILLPRDSAPVVKFNEEIGWTVQTGLAPTSEHKREGDTVLLSDIKAVNTVRPPKINGERVAFIFLFVSGRQWKILWDATPNLSPGGVSAAEGDVEWALGKEIAVSINEDLQQRAIGFHTSVETETRKIGLWTAPALLAYPLATIAEECRADRLLAAREILVSHCTPKFLGSRVRRWDSIPAFQLRRQLFSDAVSAHGNGQYTLSVLALLPQVEGVATDWLRAQIGADDVPWRDTSKLKKLRDVLLGESGLAASGRAIAHSLVSFITTGPMLETFKDRTYVADEFPNRHAVGHGKFDAEFYTEEMSIKTFLLLDTIHHLFTASTRAD